MYMSCLYIYIYIYIHTYIHISYICYTFTYLFLIDVHSYLWYLYIYICKYICIYIYIWLFITVGFDSRPLLPLGPGGPGWRRGDWSSRVCTTRSCESDALGGLRCLCETPVQKHRCRAIKIWGFPEMLNEWLIYN